MRNIIFISLFILTQTLQAGVIVLEGQYQKQNIYVHNGFNYSGVGYCIYEVLVNGSVSTDELNSSSFEIDLEQFMLDVGAPVIIEIKYRNDGCMPKVLNPNALKPNPTFETSFIHIDNNGLLEWQTFGETASLSYIVEQFKWNKWVQVGEVQGVGTPEIQKYSFQTEIHAGNNKFRVKQRGYIDKTKHSPSVSVKSSKPEISFVYDKTKQNINFSEKTHYEVYDKFGDLMKKGYGNIIDVNNLKKETYYLNFGNTNGEFKKK
jgi:hypothetical protein